MKKIYFLLFTLSLASLSFGQVIVSEDFTYADGSLVPNGGWTTGSGNAGDLLVSSGQAVVQHGTPSEDARQSFTANAGGDIYYALDFSVDDLGAPYDVAGTDNEYFSHVNFRARLSVGPGTSGGDYTVGIGSSSAGQAIWSTDLVFGVTYRAVVRYEQGAGLAELWINPANSGSTSISGTADGPTTITSFDLRQSDSSENETVRVDDLMIGNTFDDVLVFSSTLIPGITITSPADGSTLPSVNVDIEYTVQDFVVGNPGAGIDGHIHYYLDGSATPVMVFNTNPISLTGLTEGMHTVDMELVDDNHQPLNPAATASVSFTVSTIAQVADVAELRTGTIGSFYELTNEAIISYIITDNNRNQKYIQDATGGVLIDDTNGTLSTVFNIGDGITGLQGQLSEFSGVLQFVPSANVATASSNGNTITPEDVTVAEYLANGEDYESELIRITDIIFGAVGVFENNTNYDIIDGGMMTICRVSFADENLVGANIPVGASSVIGLGAQFNADYQVLPRYVTDVAGASLSVDQFELNSFNVYPNPTSTGFVNITSRTNDTVNVIVFDILGKQVLNTAVTNSVLNVSSLNTGIYIMNITQNGASITKKLVVK